MRATVLRKARPINSSSTPEQHELFRKHMDLADLAAKTLIRQVKARDLEVSDLRAMGHEKLWELVRRPDTNTIRDFKTYARAAIFNHIRTRLRLEGARTERFVDVENRGERNSGANVGSLIERFAEKPRLLIERADLDPIKFREQLLEGLSHQHRTIVELYLAGRPHTEIAQQVGFARTASVTEFITRRLRLILEKQGRADKFRDLLEAA